MLSKGFLIRVEAKPDRVDEVEAMLKSAIDHVRAEGLATVWFGLRLGPTSFAIFDAFTDEAAREAHWQANATTLTNPTAATLFADSPAVQRIDIVASLLPNE
ncbi:putative quinol monooxygenase [Kribbella sp. NPDC055071]